MSNIVYTALLIHKELMYSKEFRSFTVPKSVIKSLLIMSNSRELLNITDILNDHNKMSALLINLIGAKKTLPYTYKENQNIPGQVVSGGHLYAIEDHQSVKVGVHGLLSNSG